MVSLHVLLDTNGVPIHSNQGHAKCSISLGPTALCFQGQANRIGYIRYSFTAFWYVEVLRGTGLEIVPFPDLRPRKLVEKKRAHLAPSS